MAKTIITSVGAWEKDAINKLSDVMTIQELLENAAKELEDRRYDPNGIDGKIARPPLISNTVKAINAFQKRFMRFPDGIISPGKTTYRKLSELFTDIKTNERKNMPAETIIGGSQMFFPFASVPTANYRFGGRRFGASRSEGKRKHAGCDLIAHLGTKIYAVADGVVVRGPYSFHHGTDAIEIKHNNFLIRYCEIKSGSGVRRGQNVKAGEVIALVGKMYTSSMLHFELYSGNSSGRLTQRGNAPFQRRSDLVNPTPYLEMWEKNLPG